MTTWCRPDSTVSPDPSKPISRFASGKRPSDNGSSANARSSHSSGTANVGPCLADHPALANLRRIAPGERLRHLRAVYGADQYLAASSLKGSASAAASAAAGPRHSIADILGWVGSPGEPVALDRDEADDEGYDDERAAATADMMASDFVDLDVAYSDEPLDLSLDKSKSRTDFESEDVATPVKRAKYHHHHHLHHHLHHHHQEPGASDAGTDDGDGGDPAAVGWNGAGIVQPHLQMAANFSTVLQYYLTAARLWQTSEAMRCHESQQQQHDSEAPDEPDAAAAAAPADPAAAVVAAMATAAAAAAAAAANSTTAAPDPTATAAAIAAAALPAAPAPSPAFAAKKRKKEFDAAAPVPVQQHADPGTQNGAMRPRKTRTTFTGKQLFELERIFEQKKYLSSNERQEVARLLNVTGSQIKIWFQNRRTKWKKQDPNTAAELAQLKSASRSQQQPQQQQAPASSSAASLCPSSATPSCLMKTSLASNKSGSDAADASASDEAHSDDGSSHRSAASPTPPV